MKRPIQFTLIKWNKLSSSSIYINKPGPTPIRSELVCHFQVEKSPHAVAINQRLNHIKSSIINIFITSTIGSIISIYRNGLGNHRLK